MSAFTLCENTGFHLRLGLMGPAGAGKTYTALTLATSLGFERVGIIDTENRSARRYAKAFPRRFFSLELGRFSPRDYLEALKAAQEAGIEVLVIDSLSHAWMGKGGVLEMVDQSARRQARGNVPNSFSGWREVTPEHNRLVEGLIRAPMHLIVTLRVKTEYLVEKDAQGKSIPRKVGLAPVQREGLEYEFDIVGELTADHDLLLSKSRCTTLEPVITRPGAELAQQLRAWLDGAEPAAPVPALGPAAAPEAREIPRDRETTWPGDYSRQSCSPAVAPARCRSCGEAVVWVRTEAGRSMPVDLWGKDGTVVGADETFQPSHHISHFATCPQAAEHRRPQEEAKRPKLAQGDLDGWCKRVMRARGLEELVALKQQLNQLRRSKGQGEVLRRTFEEAEAKLRDPAYLLPAWRQKIRSASSVERAEELLQELLRVVHQEHQGDLLQELQQRLVVLGQVEGDAERAEALHRRCTELLAPGGMVALHNPEEH